MSITLIIIVVTIIASIFAWNKEGIMQKWIFNPYSVWKRNEYHRLITSGFIHRDGMHLFFNMFTLYFFGGIIESFFQYKFGGTLGVITYLAFYLLTMIIADIKTLIQFKDEPMYNALGASGAVSAIVFASILLDPVSRICLYGIFCLPGFILGALYLIYTIVQARRAADGINHDAHLYGALSGILILIILQPNIINVFFQQLKGFSIF